MRSRHRSADEQVILYKFVVDGNWTHDPNARENVANEHGSLNSVTEIRP